MGDLRKIESCRPDFEGNKNLAMKYLGKNAALKKISLILYNAPKNLTPLYVEEKVFSKS